MNRRTLTLIVAAVLAIGAGLLTFDYLLSVNHNKSSAPPRSVLVAAADIPARSTITAANINVVSRPADTVDPNAFSKFTDIKPGSVALITIPAGTTLSSALIGLPAEAALPVHLRSGMRAVAIPVDIVKAIAGLVQPGDEVDVIAVPPRDPLGQPKAYTILRSVRVLAVNASIEAITTSATPAPPGQAEDPRTITLEVTPAQADLLTMADLNSVLRLALRSPQDHTRALPPENLVFAQSLPPGNGAASGPSNNGSGKGAPAAPHRISISPVTVIDGDEVENTTEK